MKRPQTWRVGVISDDGSHDIITNGTTSSNLQLDDIESVVFPIRFSWTTQAELQSTPLKIISSNERQMGPETGYMARVEDTEPESWEINLEVWEYPAGSINHAQLEHTKNITWEDWELEKLTAAMDDQF